MIYCCGGYHSPTRTLFVPSGFRYRDRKLEVLVCPTCGKLVAELVQFDVKKNQYQTIRPKKKNTKKFIQDVESGKFDDVKIQYGTKLGAAYIFGLNKECNNGKIYQYAVDFNGKKKLVKIIE